MSLQSDITQLRTILEQTLGPDGSIVRTLDEIKRDLKDGTAVMSDHNIRIDRLEQKQKARSKLFWAAATSWVGLAVAGVWDRFTRAR